MRRLIFFFTAAVLAAPAWAQVSSGGNFTLTLSNEPSGGGEGLTGGSFWARGAIGQSLLPPPSYGPDLLRGGAFEFREGFFNPPRFSLQNVLPNTAGDSTGAASLGLPPLAVDAPTFDAVFRRDPLNYPLSVDPNKIRSANAAMRANKGELAQANPDNIWEIHLMDDTGLHDGPLAAPGVVSFRYLDANGDGIVDGTNPPLRAKTINLWMLDEAQGLWVKVPKAVVGLGDKTVSAPLNHLSVYALIGGADTSVADAYAYPVPFRPHGPQAGTGTGQTGTEASGITFTNLPSEGRIEIYTLAGKLVRGMDIPFNLAPAKLAWDVKNDAGNPVASGVYIWRVVAGSNSKQGRLMVIR